MSAKSEPQSKPEPSKPTAEEFSQLPSPDGSPGGSLPIYHPKTIESLPPMQKRPTDPETGEVVESKSGFPEMILPGAIAAFKDIPVYDAPPIVQTRRRIGTASSEDGATVKILLTEEFAQRITSGYTGISIIDMNLGIMAQAAQPEETSGS